MTASRGVQKVVVGIQARIRGDTRLENGMREPAWGCPMLPATRQLVIARIACAIHERMQGKLD
jgi:hypothetical protein